MANIHDRAPPAGVPARRLVDAYVAVVVFADSVSAVYAVVVVDCVSAVYAVAVAVVVVFVAFVFVAYVTLVVFASNKAPPHL